MLTLTEKTLRDAFVNTSQRERKAIALPAAFETLDWESLDYLGWRDPRFPQQGYVVGEVDGEPVGILMRQADARTRSRPQCAWCEDIRLPNDVVFFSVKRTGAAGRGGDSVGTLACANFECSKNVRTPMPPAYLGFDVDAARDLRILTLRERVSGFLRDIRDGH